MTDKSAAAARELVERWMGKKHPITMRSYVSDLTALISEHYYPKEFVEWTMMQGIMGIYDRKGYLYSSALLNLKGFKGDNTIKNLFNYWEENER
jgi:hypothetical protein